MNERGLLALRASTLLVFLAPTFGYSATHLVPTSYATIQQAILASTAGDTVLVLPGTYIENIVIDRSVVVKSAQGPAVTLIDGGSPPNPFFGSVVRMSAGSLEGFAIQNGRGSFPGAGNGWRGGGILITGGSAPGLLIRNNWIHDNRVIAQSGWAEGGGIAILDAAVARIMSNRIFNNHVDNTSILGSSIGPAISDQGPGSRIEGNEIFDNGATVADPDESFHLRGAISCREALVLRNVVACNVGGVGAAIHCSGIVESNTVVGNSSFGADAAVYLWDQSDGVVIASNNSVCYNIGQGLECAAPAPMTTYLVECNDFFGNGPGGEVSGACSDVIDQDGNISVDPEYSRGGCPSTHGDWCLDADSPLLPENSPPGCGLIGALGLCSPIAVPEVEAGSSSNLRALPAHPNPFFERTMVAFHLPRPGGVEVGIYDVQGRKIRSLHEATLAAGDNDIEWDGRVDEGARAPSGAYVAVIRSGGVEVTRTLLLVR